MTRRKPLTLNAGKVEQLPDGGAVAGVVPVRQTVLTGVVDSSGFPNALSAGAGLSVTLTASSGTPFLLAFAAGFDSNGTIDYLGQFTANQTFSSLTASTTCYLYVDRASDGTLSLGFSVLAPAYDRVTPSSPATDQHWFDLCNFQMKRWSGSAWVAFQRVFIGDAVTGASTITTVRTYAYRRSYRSLWTAVTTNGQYTLNHNLGIPLAAAQALVQLYSCSTASDIDDPTPHTSLVPFTSISTLYGAAFRGNLTNPRYALGFLVGTNGVHNNGSSWATSGYYKLIVTGGW